MKLLQPRLYGAVAAATSVLLPMTTLANQNPFGSAQTGRTYVNTIATNAGINTTGRTPEAIVGTLINIVLGFLGVLLLLYFLYAGFLWMTSGGDTTQADKAKQYIKNAVIGLIIIVTSFALSTFVLDQLVRVTSGT